MLSVLLSWIIYFLIFLITGFAILRILDSFLLIKNDDSQHSIDEYFFAGFLSLSLVSGILSIFIPVGRNVLIITGTLSLILWIVLFKEIIRKLKQIIIRNQGFSIWSITLMVILILFILSAVVHENINSDTGLYHTQYIKWIRNYPVVPGLGNIHGRFAFNSMFFVISALFTIETKDTIIYSLTSLCFIIFMIKMISVFYKEIRMKNTWKPVLYALLLIVSSHVLFKGLNAPSPDMICSILIIYTFVYFLDLTERSNINTTQYILLNLLVFTCGVFKLSYFLAALLIIPLWKKDLLKKVLISFIIVTLIVFPFIIRNYYLSGYLIYPFPSIDLFRVDWKIPLASVINEKSWIESWARIPGKPFTEVLDLRIGQWIGTWFRNLDNFIRVMLIINALSLILISVLTILRKEYNNLVIMMVIIAIYIFWFKTAPDPRFIYGLIIFNFAFFMAFMIRQIKFNSTTLLFKLFRITFICLLLMFILKFRNYPAHTRYNKDLWILPASIETPVTEERKTNFTYRVSLSDSRCYNSEIPCVPFPLSNVVLRGEDLRSGFKVIDIMK